MSASPLRGLLVVDLSRLLPGPLAARLLADLGARVVKVEEPRMGDPVRLAPPLVKGRGALAALLLSGVESVALDLKRPAAREVLDRLLDRADVLLDNFRPGTLDRLGLDDATLARRWPRLVACSLTGWGAEGPYSRRAGHDLTYQAAAGALAPMAPTAGAMPALPVADVAGAWTAVAAILAALVERGRTGRGGRIDAALFDAALHANVVGWSEEAGGEKKVGEPLPLSGALPCYQIYKTRDGGRLALAALEPHFWRRFCAAADRGDLVDRQYDRDPRARREVAAVVAGRTLGEWEALAADRDLPLEAVVAPAEAANHPQARARKVLGEGPDGLPRLAFPARFDGERPRAGDRLPGLGEDTAALLAELGVEIPRPRWRAAGVGPRLGLRRLLTRWAVGRRG
jgi:alpha-methylacyl-CoA racemase